MMRNHVRSHARLTGAAALALAQLAVIACDTMQLAAPTNSTVTVTSGALVLPAGGSTAVSAFVAESSGTPVQNGTSVRFTTTLGRVDPVEAQTRNGIAVTMFHAGDISGVADIRATSGSTGGGTTGGTGPGNGDLHVDQCRADQRRRCGGGDRHAARQPQLRAAARRHR